MRTGDPGTLPSSIRSLCEGGISWDKLGYKSQFAARKSVLFYMCIAGWTFDDACRYILSDSARPVYDLWGDIERYVAHTERQKRLYHDWQPAKVFADQHIRERPNVLAICGELRQHVEEWHWRGQGGRTDRDVILAAITWAEESGWLAVRLAQRSTAIAAGCTGPTAGRSIKRLIAAGWLERTRDQREAEQGLQDRPRKQILDVLQDVPNKELGLENSMFGKSCNSIAGEESGVYLGKSPQAILRIAGKDLMTNQEIAVAARIHKSTASRSLKILKREELMEEADGRWRRTNLSLAVYDPGTKIVAERKAFYSRESEAYAYIRNEYGKINHRRAA